MVSLAKVDDLLLIEFLIEAIRTEIEDIETERNLEIEVGSIRKILYLIVEEKRKKYYL